MGHGAVALPTRGLAVAVLQWPFWVLCSHAAGALLLPQVRRKKKESLHNEWSTQVFDTIQGRLQAAVDARDPAAIESRLKTQYDQYLHTTNTKVAVFRDVIIEQVGAQSEMRRGGARGG